MDRSEMTRRQVVRGTVGVGVGLSALVSSAAAQQRAEIPAVTPQALGEAHRDMLFRLARALGGRRLDSTEVSTGSSTYSWSFR
jgi:hypothetical protein